MDEFIVEAAKKNFEAGIKLWHEKGYIDQAVEAGLKQPEPVFGAADKYEIKALLDDVENLSLEKAALEQKVQEALEMDLEERAAYWKNRCLMAEKKKGEFDQTA